MATSDAPQPPEPLRNHGGSVSAKVLRRYIWRRMNLENQHFMGVVVGREGSGKSHTALRICEACDPSFDADRVFFDPRDLLEAFQSDELGAGNMIMLDEAGVGLGNRSWYEKEQILLNQTLQTVRDENMGVLYTLPRLSELDSQTIGRLHSLLSMQDLNKDEGYATLKWKNIEPNREDRNGKIYKKYPRMRVDGREHRVTSIAISAPSTDLAEAYEGRKEAFKDDLYERAIEAQESAAGEENSQTPQDVAEEVLEDDRVDEFVSHHGQTGRAYVDKDLLAAEYGLSVRKSNTAKKLIEKEATLSE